MDGESASNYPAFFDYAYRWMMNDDTEAVAEIKAQTGFDSSSFMRQGQTKWLAGQVSDSTFVDDMWHADPW
jgi:hypothetical protein